MREIVRPMSAQGMGRASEEPVVLTNIICWSFFAALEGDDNPLDPLTDRMDWRQCCDLPLDAALPERRPLVTCRRRVGLSVMEGMFAQFFPLWVEKERVAVKHRFFDGTPVKASASSKPSREEVETASVATMPEKGEAFHEQPITLAPSVKTTPVTFTNAASPADKAAVEARRSPALKPVGDRQAAGDPEARCQRGKHGNRRA